MPQWSIQAVDFMKFQQDSLDHPISFELKQKAVNRAKELGATHFPNSTPYDTPPGRFDAVTQTREWITAIKNARLLTWHRQSWCSDQGFYGVAHNNGDTRIEDTVNYIRAHPDFYQNGDIFTPKPEPQNCRVIGVNWGNPETARFRNVAGFNDWLRNMTNGCRQAFNITGFPTIKVGYWGFDGFVTCGYGNPDWQGKSFLEKATVDMMEDGIAVDHYPPANTTMADFIRVFKQVWPGKNLIIGEYGAKGTDANNVKAQINEVFTTLKNEPIVKGVNYWPAAGGIDGPLMNDNFEPVLGFDTVKGYFTSGSPTPPTPPTPPVPPTTPPTPPTTPPLPPVPPLPEGEKIVQFDGGNTIIVLTNKGKMFELYNGNWDAIDLPDF